MIRKTVTYRDYNGNMQTEDCYFHLNQAELFKLESDDATSLSAKIKTVMDSMETMKKKDEKAADEYVGRFMADFIPELILISYGEKSEDGKHFRKSEELTENFKQSALYPELVFQLMSHPDTCYEFINKVLPESLMELVKNAENVEALQMVK